MKNKLLYIVLIIVIIIGAIVYKAKGFNKELNYSNRQEFEISAASTFDVSKVESIAKEILSNRKVKVQKVERFDNALEIISTEISEEEKQNIINKVNEEYNENISNEGISIITITSTRVLDIFKPYVFTAIISLIIVMLYFLLLYNKIGIKTIFIKGVTIPILLELAYYAIILITRLPLGRVTNSIAVSIYLIAIGALSICFQNEKEKMIIKEENEKENDE